MAAASDESSASHNPETRPGAQHLRQKSSREHTAEAICACYLLLRKTGSTPPCPSSPRSLAGCPWNDLHLVTHFASVGSCHCLLILSFTYNRRVLFTNRIQNSRCFIMSLRCVLTNAAGRLPWLPLCRLLPGLWRTALPCHWGTQFQNNKHALVFAANLISRLFDRRKQNQNQAKKPPFLNFFAIGHQNGASKFCHNAQTIKQLPDPGG